MNTNICVPGDKSVDNTTFISILLNKLEGIIEASITTLKWD